MAKAAKKEETAVATKSADTGLTTLPAYDPAVWGAPSITAKDIVIPKILAMQAMTKAVIDGSAKFGEFRESLSGVVLGDTQTPIEFIPFHMEKVWIIFEKEGKGDKFKFSGVIPIIPANENLTYEGENDEGTPIKRYRTLNFYVLLPKEVEAGTAIPYMLSFRSSSAKAGTKLTTMMYMKNIKAGKLPASTVMTLHGEKTQNDDGTFIVMDVKEKRESTAKEVHEAFEWVKTVRSGAVKVDHSDLEAAPVQDRARPVQASEVPESAEY